ncbi:hypothetical protein JTB14_018105 [Gonioctena quinquepunctata]|nr:hypothetical protein JTB14_018105 [Gonioctena quinquepunctata]
MESSHSEPPEPEPPDKASTPPTSPSRKSRSREKTEKRQCEPNQSEQTQCAQLVPDPQVVATKVRNILRGPRNYSKSNNSSRNSSCSSTDERKRDSVRSSQIPEKQNNESEKSVKTVNTLAGVRGKDTDSDSVSLADKCASSEDLSLEDVTIMDVTNTDVTDVTSESSMIIEGNVISSPESPLMEPQEQVSRTTLLPRDRPRIELVKETSRKPDIEGISSNKDNPTPSSGVPSIVVDIKAEATELEPTKAPELIVTAEPVNSPNEAYEAPSTELDVYEADSSKVWAAEVDEASDEAFGEHESPSFSPKAGNTEEVQVDISKTHDIDYESLESNQTLDGSEKSEANPAGNARGAEIGRAAC